MRLGADALVLSVNKHDGGLCAGLLSFTMLKATNETDVVVPIVEWDANGRAPRTDAATAAARSEALQKLLSWSTGYSEAQLVEQIRKLRPHGTSIRISNLWLTDTGSSELDLISDLRDLQTRPPEREVKTLFGEPVAAPNKKEVNRDRYYIYERSLRAYASILYLKWPQGFELTLRGKKVEPKNILKDLKHVRQEKYCPKEELEAAGPGRAMGLGPGDAGGSGGKKSRSKNEYTIHVGFAKEAPDVDAQGFFVYHNNRLIKKM